MKKSQSKKAGKLGRVVIADSNLPWPVGTPGKILGKGSEGKLRIELENVGQFELSPGQVAPQ